MEKRLREGLEEGGLRKGYETILDHGSESLSVRSYFDLWAYRAMLLSIPKNTPSVSMKLAYLISDNVSRLFVGVEISMRCITYVAFYRS